MEIRELTREELRALYRTRMEEDFPPSELRPLSNMEELLDQKAYLCLGCREEQEKSLGGYALFALRDGAALLDYFAVDAARRGTGIGSAFLSALRSRGLGVPWFLIEVESLESAETPEERALRERRIRFYRRCGCQETQVYSLLFGVEYQILVMPMAGAALPADGEVQAALEGLYRMMILPMVQQDERAYRKVCRCFQRISP